jgi:hypothetical protein
MELVLFILIPITLVAVLGTLVMGMYALRRGGEFGRKWSNRLMRLRIGLQFAAVVMLLAFVALRAGRH